MNFGSYFKVHGFKVQMWKYKLTLVIWKSTLVTSIPGSLLSGKISVSGDLSGLEMSAKGRDPEW